MQNTWVFPSDFLKHYEDLGILTPSRSESGYRYYPFTATMILIECIRLRNFGMTLRALNLKGGETYYRTTLIPADWKQDISYQYGYYAIPIHGLEG